MLVVAAVCSGLATWLLIPGSSWVMIASRIQRHGLLKLWRGKDGCYSLALRVSAGLFAATMCWILSSQLVMALLAFLACFVVLGQVESPLVRRQQRVLLSQADSALELLAIALSVGAPLRIAVEVVAEVIPVPTSQVLTLVQTQTAIGRSDSEAWLELANHPVWGSVARDLARSVDVGAGLVELLDLHAEEIREARQEDRERSVRSVGVRAVLPLMCCFLPAFLLVGVLPIIASTLGNLLTGL